MSTISEARAEARRAMRKAWDEWRAVLKAADAKRDDYIDAHNAYLKLLNEPETEAEA